MKTSRCIVLAVAVGALPALAAAQATNMAAPAASTSPVADGLRQIEKFQARNLMGAFQAFPADKYSYRPTPAQMSVAAIALHLTEANDMTCAQIGGVTSPKRSAMDTTASKDSLVARLGASFEFCEQALAKADDSKLGEQMPFFGGRPVSRAFIEFVTAADWADHYSQMSNYLRLNGLLPPTAQPRPAAPAAKP